VERANIIHIISTEFFPIAAFLVIILGGAALIAKLGGTLSTMGEFLIGASIAAVFIIALNANGWSPW
jgi:hypothetical protein